MPRSCMYALCEEGSKASNGRAIDRRTLDSREFSLRDQNLGIGLAALGEDVVVGMLPLSGPRSKAEGENDGSVLSGYGRDIRASSLRCLVLGGVDLGVRDPNKDMRRFR